MTVKEVYDELFKPRNIELKIKKLETKATALRWTLSMKGIVYSKDKVQLTPEDQMAEVMASVIELEAEILQLRQDQARAINIIIGMVERLDNDEEKLVLTDRFIGRFSLSRAADHIPCSKPTAFRIEHRAVSHLAEIFVRREDETNETMDCDMM